MNNLKEARAGFDTFGNSYPVADHIIRKKVHIGGIPCAWFIPEETSHEDVVIYIHGGAFMAGSITSHTPLVSHIANRINRKVLLIDYRLSPEHPFSAGLEDCVQVIQTLYGENPQIRFGIMGDSAGGNLAMASQLLLKKTNGLKADYTAIISPWVNLQCNTPSYTRNKDVDTILGQSHLMESALMYSGGHDLKLPELSPVYGDFQGLAPVLIMVGTHEILEDDSVQLQQQLESCGVTADLRLFKDQLHVWPFMNINTPASQEALDTMAAFVKKYTSDKK